jgi:hypothetical protein
MTPTAPSPTSATIPDVDARSRASTTWVVISFRSTRMPSMTLTLLLCPPSVRAPARPLASARPRSTASGATTAAVAGSRASVPSTSASATTPRRRLRRAPSSTCPSLFCTSASCRFVWLVDMLFLRTLLCEIDTINHCRRVWRVHRLRHSPYVNIRATIRTVLLFVRTQRRSWSNQCRRSFLFPFDTISPEMVSMCLVCIVAALFFRF